MLKAGTRWRIGDGRKVSVWHDAWLREEDSFEIQTPVLAYCEDMKVQDLMIPGCREWDVELISEYFNDRDARAIVSIPLREDGSDDVRIWHYSKDGVYTVKTGYRVALEVSRQNDDLGVPGDWRKLWKLKIPPKVKAFLRRATRNCLPTRDNLRYRGISIPSSCVFCNEGIENSWHVFIACPFTQGCWSEARLLGFINSSSEAADGFSEWILDLLHSAPGALLGKVTVIL